MRFRTSFAFAFSLASLGTSACNLGQIGGEVETGGDGCEIAGSEPRGDDEASSLGVSAAELMVRVTGRHTVPLRWNAGSNGVAVTPAAGDSSISFDVEPIAGSARFVELEVADQGGMELAASADGCGDELRFSARVTVTTDNGALNDEFEVEFRASSPQLVRADIPLPLAELEGSFRVDASALDAQAEQTTLHVGFVGQSPSGWIDGIWSTVDETAASATSFEYGHFPLESCGSYGGHVIDGESEFGQKLSTWLAEPLSFDVTWNDGSPITRLEVESTLAGPLCYGVPWSASGVIADVSTRVTSDDGRIDATWTLEAQFTLDATSAANRLDVVRQAYLSDHFEAADFAAESGISGVDLGNAEVASFSFAYGLDAGASATGALTILVGQVTEGCVEEPAPGDDEPAGACNGIDWQEPVQATLAEVE